MNLIKQEFLSNKLLPKNDAGEFDLRALAWLRKGVEGGSLMLCAPRATPHYSSEELENIGMVGIYRCRHETPDEAEERKFLRMTRIAIQSRQTL